MIYADFDPHLIRQRNHEMLQEVQTLRLDERLQASCESGGSWLEVLAHWSSLLLRRIRLAG
jgi:hypothetical protein